MPENIILPQELAGLRRRIEELNLPAIAYAAIGITDDEFIVAIIDSDHSITAHEKTSSNNQHEDVLAWLRSYTVEHNEKVIAATLFGTGDLHSLGSRLWLEEDIVPYVLSSPPAVNRQTVHKQAHLTSLKFDANNLVKVVLSSTNEVEIARLVTSEDYRETVSTSAWQRLQREVKTFQQKKNRLVFFNATPQGGGVALMRHGLLRCLKLLGVEAQWHVMQPNRDIFEITKTKFHNVLQAVAPEGVTLTDHDKEAYRAWSEENATLLSDIIRQANVIVIDDPQPSGMIPLIKEKNPDAKIIYRSHIHLDKDLLSKPDTPQYQTWQFLWKNIQLADVFISHPVAKFIPDEAFERTLTMPATTDPLDGLNKNLNEEQLDYYIRMFNKILLEHDQKPLDAERPYIIQIARFDPSKGIPDVIEAFHKLREKLPMEKPQLVLVGHGSIDDPDGIPIYNMVIHLLQSPKYADIAADVKVVRLHHNDQILNALLRRCYVALQLSHKEGFEVKISEGLHKSKPVIAYRAGGIPLQIEHGVTGFLCPVGNIPQVAEHLVTLFTNKKMYSSMSSEAAKRVRDEYFTVHNAWKWLYLANQLRNGNHLPGRGESLSQILEHQS